MKLRSDGMPVGLMIGADAHAHRWAVSRKVLVRFMPADWDRHGRGAGPIRNSAMLRSEQFCKLVAFPGGDGTNGAVEIARALAIPVRDERGYR